MRGEIVETTPQDCAHATAITLADRLLQRKLRDVFVVRTQLPLSLGPDSEPEPDIAVVEGDPRCYAETHPTAALLVLEVSESSLAYDRAEKAELYAVAGVPDYWILNLADRQLEVHRGPIGDRFGETRIYSASDSVRPLFAPVVSIAVSDLLP